MADRRQIFVVDASVMIKWLFQHEEYSEKALDLRSHFLSGKVALNIPVHSFFEVMNTVVLKSPTLALQFLSQLFYSGIIEHTLDLSLASLAADIINQFPKVSFYDAVYHALAMKIGGTFITADEKYYEASKSLRNIMLLKDYSYN